MKKFLLCVILTFLPLYAGRYCVAQRPSLPDNGIHRLIESAVAEEMKNRSIPGASVAIVRNDKVVFLKGFGMANVERRLPAGPNTRYQIGSATKPFTAMAILMLVEDREVSLDEKVSKYLPRLPGQYAAITVRQLLAHTSGVNRDLRTGNTDDFSTDEFWRRLSAAAPSFEPGTRWEYSNTGYILLGLIVEAVTRKSYGQFLNERMFRPLSMKDTAYLEPPGKDKDQAVGYESEGGALIPSRYFSGGFAAGGLVSTASDLAKWAAALNTEKLLKRSVLERIWSPENLADGKSIRFDFRGRPTSYGLGWFLTSYGGKAMVFHGGTLSGFSSQIIRIPDDKITVIVICNSKSSADRIGHADFIAKRIAELYLPSSGVALLATERMK